MNKIVFISFMCLLTFVCCSDDDDDGVHVIEVYSCPEYTGNEKYNMFIANSADEASELFSALNIKEEDSGKNVLSELDGDFRNYSLVCIYSNYYYKLESIKYIGDNCLAFTYRKPFVMPAQPVPHCDIVKLSPKLAKSTKITIVEKEYNE